MSRWVVGVPVWGEAELAWRLRPDPAAPWLAVTGTNQPFTTVALGRGWSEEDCRRLAGGNILRVMREAEAAARAIGEQRGPSTARIS